MNVKKLIREHLLSERKNLILERKIAEIKANLIISYNLKHTDAIHGRERQYRHANEEGGQIIHDIFIKSLIESAKDDITFNIVIEEIKNNVRFIVSQIESPHLNVIIEPEMLNPYEWNLNVISVMNKLNYSIGRGQLQIFASTIKTS